MNPITIDEAESSTYTTVSSSSSGDICKAFELKTIAQHVVKGTMKHALKGTTERTIKTLQPEHKPLRVPNIKWPCNYEFTTKIGEEKIKEFIGTWERDPKWLFCIDFIFRDSDIFSSYYIYKVKWSIPTPAYPIPQATVNVYFTIEVSKTQSEYCPVNVRYQFETDPYIHRPGETKFREEWISDILDRKIKFFKTLRF